MSSELHNQFNNDRLSSRQIDELIGIARGLLADGSINQAETEFLHKWLAANVGLTDQPVIGILYKRVREMLKDGVVDDDERAELLDTLSKFSAQDFELGEVLKATTLPVCRPVPRLEFDGRLYCFTGTFTFGARRDCEAAVIQRGGIAGSLTQKTDVLVIGMYATESWKHSSFGTKILKACDYRDKGLPISIVSEADWTAQL